MRCGLQRAAGWRRGRMERLTSVVALDAERGGRGAHRHRHRRRAAHHRWDRCIHSVAGAP